MQQFTDQIRDLIEELGLSYRAAAEKIGIDHGNLSKILSGKEGLTFTRAEHIASKLGATLSIKVKKSTKITAT